MAIRAFYNKKKSFNFFPPFFRLSRGDLKTIGKIIYKKGSVTVDGPDPHKISRKLSDPDIHHILADSSASPHTASSINSTSLSIGIGLTSSSSIKQSMTKKFIFI